MSEAEKCPKCGGEMEKGYLSSKMVAWSDKKISNWSWKGIWRGEMIINRGYPYPIDNVEAYRCRKCNLIIFQYGKTN
jgi:hypothetical protein